MAELVISALLPLLFEKLASAALKTIARSKGIDTEINKWQRSLLQIQGLLTDASKKEITSLPVKRWLTELQHLAYDIDDVLDELATEAIHRELSRESVTTTSKVRKLIPTCCTSFKESTRTHDKLDDITTKLQDLLEEKAALGLSVKEESSPKNKNRRLQTSVVDASSIVGRQAEKEALVQRLLSPCDQNYSIVPIVGMGGVGKTTLARLLYDDQQVKDHFELKAWVCVSDEFDSFGISKIIFQAVARVNKEFADLNLLQEELTIHLKGKRFLLVLDDVWSDSYEDWETLVGPLYACAPGSKVIMTTRKEKLLQKLGYDNPNHLQRMSLEDALSLFALHALGVNNFDSHLSFKPHAEGIVKKCDGLPLALAALGRLLRTKKDEYSWKEVLESEIWKLPVEDEIIPALRLSYHDLPASLKQLFAYCSLFPKDFLFNKEELVLLWMAEGFLHQSTSSRSTEEHLGREYFDELLSRSFFQQAPNNESLFVMHDLMNDLATYVAGEFFVRLGNETEKNTRKEMQVKYRHMSFVRAKYVAYEKFKVFEGAKSMRTFFVTSVGVEDTGECLYLSNKILVDLLPKLRLLRVLSLSGFEIVEVPDSIGTLKHLRYLNLSHTSITHLPEEVCNLYNLHTLILFGCGQLFKLPNSFLKLKKLRHLDITHTQLFVMPLGIGELKNLQTLSNIIVGGESRFEIADLKNLENLCGRISIVGLENVENAIHAREAKLSQKRFSELEVVWSDASDGSRNEMLENEVLNELKPCNEHLNQLKIVSYGGLEFPDWVGNSSFQHLKHVKILNCQRCTSLPPLGQLRLLKELFLERLYGVEVVGLELLGTSGAFPSLEILSFEDMHGWKKWSMNTWVVFPCLKQLHINNCPNLAEVTLEDLPSLNYLEITYCPNLVEVTLKAIPSLNALHVTKCDSCVLRTLVEIAPAVNKLEIDDISSLNDVMWRGVTEYLGALEKLSIYRCNEIRHLWESEEVASKFLVNLRNLKVFGCYNLVSLGEKEEVNNCRSGLLTSLRVLHVSYCKNMEYCSFPHNIEMLSVLFCESVTSISLPTRGQKLKSVDIWGCNKLLDKEWGGQKINNNGSGMPMLESVYIVGWPNLKSIIELKYLVHLTKLRITNCESLESFPDSELPKLTSLKELEITNCPRMDACFPRGFWPPKLQSLKIGKLTKSISEWGPQNFPISLVKLEFYGDDGVRSCSQLSGLLHSSLTYLKIEEFEKLESVSVGLQHLTSLQHLYFYKCPNMMDLPKVLLPSLLSLEISYCPKLKERCSKKGCYWPHISHIPYINI